MNIECTSTLKSVFYIIKNINNLIFLIAPILAIICIIIILIKKTTNPEDKKLLSKLKNSIIALIVVFIIPTIMNAFLFMLGENNSLTSCYQESNSFSHASQYLDSNEKEKDHQFVLDDSDDYEKGIPKTLDFSCRSSKVKAQFSCSTLEIVEKHLNDFNAQNYNNVMASYGGFDQYAKRVGGIFGDYYGHTVTVNTEAEYQKLSEYVLGWMYMFGWDYMNGSGRHVKWGGSKYTSDAFYVNGGFQGKYKTDNGKVNFDSVISAKFGTGYMSSECGDLELFIYAKMGMNNRKQLPKVTRLRDLQVGDGVYFGRVAWDKLNEKTWKEGAHNVIVGEVYTDHIVFYDGGSYYQINQNYKRTVYFPKEDSEAADDAAIKKEFGYASWGMRRWRTFDKS